MERAKKGLTNCPACGAEYRGRADPRGSVGITGDNKGWRCYVCSSGGDAADLLAYSVIGKRIRECDGDELDLVRERAEELEYIQPEGKPPKHRRSATGGARRGGTAAPRRTPPPAPGEEIERPAKKRRSMRLAATRRGDGSVSIAQSEVKTWGLAWDPDLQDRAQETLWNDEAAAHVLAYLTDKPDLDAAESTWSRGLSPEVLKKWRIGAVKAFSPGEQRERWWVVIPLWDVGGRCVNYKFRAVPEGESDKPKPKYMTCPGRPLPLFGARALSNDLGAEVLICEGELDVLAMWDFGWQRNVVSGTSGDNWEDEWLDALEPYQAFVLMHDDDEAGEGVSNKVAEALGRERCTRARLPYNDAGRCLQYGVITEAIDRAIDQAESLVQMRIVRPSAHREAIERRITDPTQEWRRRGRPTGSAELDKHISGWPAGVVVVTGHSGSGKTSFCDWAAYVQAAKFGVPTLITSFENGDEDVADDLVRMVLEDDPAERTATERGKAWDTIDQIPLWIVAHQGFTAPDKLMEAMRFAYRRKGVRFFVVDHLGYTIDYGAKASETAQLDATTKMFSAFARDYGCTILLIAHPTKQHRTEQRRATLYDAKGAVSIEQEATAGIALEIDRGSEVPRTFLHVDKWRPKFGSGVGSCAELYYDPVANHYGDSFESLPLARSFTMPQEK